MGATAIGTGLNAPAGYAQKCTAHLATITGLPIYLASDLIEATQDTQAFVLYSSCMKSLAIKLSKVCNDLRLLSSGPRCGLREINLPPKQPGSSIMPGKVNPVIPEVVNMVCFRVIGSDQTVTMAAEAGQLQLNVFEPVIAACIFEAQTMFINAARTLRVHCVDGITANPDVCRHYVDYSIGTVTALNPVIGYDRATELAAEATKTGRGILELVREKRILSEQQIAEVLDPMAMTGSAAVRRDAPGRIVLPRPRWCCRWRFWLPRCITAAQGGGRAERLADVSGQLVGRRPASDAAHRGGTHGRDRPAFGRGRFARPGQASTGGFQGEAIGVRRRRSLERGPGGVDRRPRRPRVQRAQRRPARDRTAHRRRDHRGHRTLRRRHRRLHADLAVRRHTAKTDACRAGPSISGAGSA